MNIAAYHGSNNGVGYYRVWNPMKHLARHGFNVRRLPDNFGSVVIPLTGKGGNFPGWESHEAVTRWANVIYSSFKQHRSETARMVAQSKLRPLVVDLDDDMMNIDPTNGAFGSWQAHPEACMTAEVPDDADPKELARLQRQGWAVVTVNGKRYIDRDDGSACWNNVIDQVKAAALVTVSTDYLAAVYGKFNPNTVVIPNAIDFELWRKVEPVDDGLVRIGLFGSNSHYRDWAEAVESIARILKEFPQVRLLFNGWLVMEDSEQHKSMHQRERRWRFPDYFEKCGLLDNPQVELHHPCEIQEYPEWLMEKRIDIGLAPLADIKFNASKSNLKYIEFGAMGVPGVYADLEPFKMVQDGVTGLKAAKPEDYYTQLKRLIEDKALRQRIGAAAHEDVKANYDADKVSLKLANEIHKLIKPVAPVGAAA